MKTINIGNNVNIFVDDEDYPVISRFTWRLIEEKRTSEINEDRVYQKVCRTINARTVFLEYFILPLDTQIAIHKNGNHLDFRKENLLPLNKRNIVHLNKKYYLKLNSTFRSKYKNVTKRSDIGDSCFQSRITYNGERIHLGTFTTEKEAALAYNEKARELYGENAYQNKILD